MANVLSELLTDLWSYVVIIGGAALYALEVVTPVLICAGLILNIALTVRKHIAFRRRKDEP